MAISSHCTYKSHKKTSKSSPCSSPPTVHVNLTRSYPTHSYENLIPLYMAAWQEHIQLVPTSISSHYAYQPHEKTFNLSQWTSPPLPKPTLQQHIQLVYMTMSSQCPYQSHEKTFNLTLWKTLPTVCINLTIVQSCRPYNHQLPLSMSASHKHIQHVPMTLYIIVFTDFTKAYSICFFDHLLVSISASRQNIQLVPLTISSHCPCQHHKNAFSSTLWPSPFSANVGLTGTHATRPCD